MVEKMKSQFRVSQSRVILILVIIAVAYFSIFGVVNNNPAMTQDEEIVYPYLKKILSLDGDIHNIWGDLIIYGDYHYGYLFYFFSSLILLPERLILGNGFYDKIQLNMFLLRQFISVLPMILAIIILVYLQTEFKSISRSIFLFLFLLFIKGVFRQNIQWWHPDAFAILFSVLTIFFMFRDQYKLGWNFYLASISCGMASAIKLIGIFFFLAVGFYLILCWHKSRITAKILLYKAILFILLMFLTFFISNPFLFYEAPRNRAVETQLAHNYIVTHGWPHDEVHETGILSWIPVMKGWYGGPVFLIFATLSLLMSLFQTAKRLQNLIILMFVMPYLAYAFTAVMVKPDHYLLPAILLLSSAIFNSIPELKHYHIQSIKALFKNKIVLLRIIYTLASIIIIAATFIYNVQECYSLFIEALP